MVASARNWTVCRLGRRGQGRVGQVRGQSKSRAGRGQKAGQGMMGMDIVQGKRAKIESFVADNFEK